MPRYQVTIQGSFEYIDYIDAVDEEDAKEWGNIHLPIMDEIDLRPELTKAVLVEEELDEHGND